MSPGFALVLYFAAGIAARRFDLARVNHQCD
jgi:hypothetical protein